MVTKSHGVTAEEMEPFLGQRLDVVIATLLQRSRSHAQVLLKHGLVDLQPVGKKIQSSYRLRAGDSLIIHDQETQADAENAPVGEAIPLEVVYEDEALLAINKQPGLVVHPAPGHGSGTLVNALVHRSAQSKSGAELDRMGLVHRLDKDTSGLLLIAKTALVHERLTKAFAAREIRKFYLALAWGVFRRKSGECREAIGRHRVHRQKMAVLKVGGRASHTDYLVLQQGPLGAEVECLLHTGRTHQIRVHLAHLKHPIWGDLIYGRPHQLSDGFEPGRQMLHATRLEFMHPLTDRPLRLIAPPPPDYQACRERLLGKG